ncbi:MAG: Wzz/FepE/Etk N-terminal domain-containing protein [Cyanobacteria bacterium P01_F01_bin.53]
MISEVLRHWAYGFSATLIGSIGVASSVSLLFQPVYESSMQILLESNAGNLTILNDSNENNSLSEVETNIEVSTEIRVMRSNQFVEQAIEELEREQPDLCEDKAVRADCIKEFQDRLTITQLKEGNIKTRVVEVVFIGPQREQTFKFLLALQKIYRTYNVEQQQERIDGRLAIFDYELSTGEKALSNFLKTSHHLSPENGSAAFRRSFVDPGLTVGSDQQLERYQESLEGTEHYGTEHYGTEHYGTEHYESEAPIQPEDITAIQLMKLRQEMANELILSGFTWKLVEYPKMGRKVFPQLFTSLTIGSSDRPLAKRFLGSGQR